MTLSITFTEAQLVEIEQRARRIGEDASEAVYDWLSTFHYDTDQKVVFGRCVIYTNLPNQKCPLCRSAIEPMVTHECEISNPPSAILDVLEKPPGKPPKQRKGKKTSIKP